jgi:hypothetical protein
MVKARVPKIRKYWGLLPREEQFCRNVVAKALSFAQSYREAYAYDGRNADVLAGQVSRRARVRARIEELRIEARAGEGMDMESRRAVLAKIAQHEKGWERAPAYSERIAAIREDATLTGERMEVGGVKLGVEIDLAAVLRAIGVGGERRELKDELVGKWESEGGVTELLQDGAAEARRAHNSEVVGSNPTPASKLTEEVEAEFPALPVGGESWTDE